MFIRRYDHQTEGRAEHQARRDESLWALVFQSDCNSIVPFRFPVGVDLRLLVYALCIGLVLLLLEQIKPIEQLVPVS